MKFDPSVFFNGTGISSASDASLLDKAPPQRESLVSLCRTASVEEDYDFAALDSSTPDVSQILLCGNRIPSLSHVSPPSNLPSREDIVPMVRKAPRPMKDHNFVDLLIEKRSLDETGKTPFSYDCGESDPAASDPVTTVLRRKSKSIATSRVDHHQKKGGHKHREHSPEPPDINGGLGKDQAKSDRVSLLRYVKALAHWMVFRKRLYIYGKSCWEVLDREMATTAIKELLCNAPEIYGILNSSDYVELYKSLLTEADLQRGGDLKVPRDAINFRDTVADLTGDEWAFMEQTPEYHFRSFIDISKSELKNPTYGYAFESFIEQISNGNSDIRRQILEMIGIALANRQLKVAYCLLGPSGTGKTTIGRFLLELLTLNNVETVRDINDFGDKWTVGSLEGKKVALCLDLPDDPIKKRPAGILKQFIGLDPIKGEVKNQNSSTLVEKPLLVLAGNHPLRMPNASEDPAFWNRIVIIPFYNPVNEHEKDEDLFLRFMDERAYIVSQAMDAYIDLAKRNFVPTRVELPLEYEPQESSLLYKSICEFVGNCLERKPGAEVSVRDIYAAFASMYPKAVSPLKSERDSVPPGFGRDLKRALSHLIPEAKDFNRVGGCFCRGYHNIKLCEAP